MKSGHIKKIDRKNPIRNKADLFKLCEHWLQESDSLSIGPLNENGSNPTPWIWVNIDGKEHKIHADTKRHGVKEFIVNKSNPWLLIKTLRAAAKIKVTNNLENQTIDGFYMYIVN
jgi:hypothetical protein